MRERGLKYLDAADHGEHGLVAPHAGAWIEIFGWSAVIRLGCGSLPMRERGLKYLLVHDVDGGFRVAPHAGAWIEIVHSGGRQHQDGVAPHAGAWIEIR